MSFLGDDDVQQGDDQTNKYLKFPELKEKGEKFEVKIRILDEKAPGVFRHWIGVAPKQRPYNCPGVRNGCPACIERNRLKDAGDPEYKALHKMDRRYFVNVLVDGEVKLYNFPTKVGEKLLFLADRYGVVEDKKTGVKEKKYDLRDMDITLVKRKTGAFKFDVEWDALFEGVRALDEDEKVLAEARYDLEAEIMPATPEIVAAAIAGQVPEKKAEEAGPRKATSEQIDQINTLKEGKYTWSQLINAAAPDALTYADATEIISSLK